MHTVGMRVKGCMVNIGSPQENFKTHVNRNAIKTRNRGTPFATFPESLTPPTPLGILEKN